jgi:hypothetical protein
MTRTELHHQLGELLYIEDYGIIDIILASITANSLKIGDPVWLTLIGPSSGGKSQMIRPFAKANPDLIHQIDDLTPNSLISGNKKFEETFLGQMGDHGILSMDDLTVLFSKNPEQRSEILSQFRMLYDGRFTKMSGSLKEASVWEGYMGMIAGSTPSIYHYFSEVADMGERFISYRMKDYDIDKAVDFVTNSNLSSQQLNIQITAILNEYMTTILPNLTTIPELPAPIAESIQQTSKLTTWMRTPVSINERSEQVDEFPIREMPFRVMKQMTAIAKAMLAMHQAEDPAATTLPDDLMDTLDWCGYSLSNDKRRAYLKYMVGINDITGHITNKNLSICTGLPEATVSRGVQQLQALGIIQSLGGDKWRLCSTQMNQLVRRLDPAPDSIKDKLENF